MEKGTRRYVLTPAAFKPGEFALAVQAVHAGCRVVHSKGTFGGIVFHLREGHEPEHLENLGLRPYEEAYHG
jgi:hypothetical protein